MNLYGIGGLPRAPLSPAPARGPAADPAEGRPVHQAPAAPHAVPGPETVDPSRQTDASVPVEPPPGTDPALWTILTGEERRFFAQARTMGPLTYGPRTSTPPSAGMTPGGRIDLRV